MDLKTTPESVERLRTMLCESLEEHAIDLEIDDPSMLALAGIQLAAIYCLCLISSKSKASGSETVEWAVRNFFETMNGVAKQMDIDFQVSELEILN